MKIRARVLLLRLFVAIALTASSRASFADVRSDGPATEDQWIVSQTARAVVDLARFVSTGLTPSPAGITVPQVTVDTYVWDPNVYLSLATASGVTPVGQDDAVEYDVAALLNPTGAAMQAENMKISAALAALPKRAANHEAAALLLTTLALREASGTFYDPRVALSRAAAHLAIAHALRGPRVELSPAGQIADLTIQVLAGRTGPAVRRMDFLAPKMSPARQAWVHALKRRATLDWRERLDAKASLLERLEYATAITRMLSVNETLAYVAEQPRDGLPDWGWRALALPPTVAAGHTFINETFAETLAEAALVLRPADDRGADKALTAALNATPALSAVDRTPGGRIRVIDDGTWGAFYQRHLAHVARRGSDFYRHTYGSKDTAAQFDALVDQVGGDLTLWPFVRELRATRPDEYAAAMARVTPVTTARPHEVPYLAWYEAERQVPSGATPVGMPAMAAWFSRMFPTGTSFEARRLAGRGALPPDVASQIEGLHQLAPWDPDVTTAWSNVRCHDCSPAERRQHYAAIADYDLWVMRRFAYDSADPGVNLRRICDVSVDDCDLLADWLLSRDRFEEAAEAGELFVRLGRDRVNISNKIEWLVRYYQRVGRAADALRIAEQAADVDSARGLSALAGYYDRAGDRTRARDLYEAAYERYGNGVDLLSFYLRQADATGRPPQVPEYTALRDRYFGTQGLLPEVASTSRPLRGLRVRSTSYFTAKAGFRRGDIVTAMDGVQVSTPNQSHVLYERSFDRPIKYTVWRVDGYITIEAPLRTYDYGVDLEPYNAN